MRQYLRPYTSRHIEKKPEHQKLHIELRRKLAIERARMRAIKHLDEITGKMDRLQPISYFFTNEGEPPRYLSVENMARQSVRLDGQLRWLEALAEELRVHLQTQSPEEYAAYLAAREEKGRELEEKKESVFRDHTKFNPPTLKAGARDIVRRAVQSDQEEKKLRQLSDREAVNTRVLMVRQIENALRHMFAAYIANPLYRIDRDETTRFRILREEMETMDIQAAEIRNTRKNLVKLLESAEEYLETKGL